eukprot:10722354-Ditylum_brightwellii.AAC.1
MRLPHSVKEAYKIDKHNGNDYWHHAIEKEMSWIRIAFETRKGGKTLEEAKKKLIGYQMINCHIVFDIKLDGLVQKARLVASGHTTDAPTDIGNAYLNAPCREKIYTVAVPEFGTEEGTIFIVVHALYGLKSAGTSWRSFFSQTLVIEMGFKSTHGDPD